MSINDNILQEIGRCIREIIPDAKVFLFVAAVFSTPSIIQVMVTFGSYNWFTVTV